MKKVLLEFFKLWLVVTMVLPVINWNFTMDGFVSALINGFLAVLIFSCIKFLFEIYLKKTTKKDAV